MVTSLLDFVAVPAAEAPASAPPVRRSRRRTYRFLITLNLDPQVLRNETRPGAWPGPIARSFLEEVVGQLPGYLDVRVAWLAGSRRLEHSDRVSVDGRHLATRVLAREQAVS